MLRSPHSPPAAAAFFSLASVSFAIDPPPQAESARVATAARTPSRAPRLRAVLMAGCLIFVDLLIFLVVRETGVSSLRRPDRQPDEEGAAGPGVVASLVCRGPGDPVEHHAEQHDRDAGGQAL